MFRALLVALMLASCVPALAATFAVGTGGGCTHTTIQAALDDAATNTAGPHKIKLGLVSYGPTGSGPNPTDALVLNNPVADIEIAGGYVNCSATQAVPGGRATIAPPFTGLRLLYINNDNSHARRTITLRALRLKGVSLGSVFGEPLGGAIAAFGKVSLRLVGETTISNNVIGGKGAGIAMGNSSATSAADNAILFLQDGSSIVDNTASSHSIGPNPLSPVLPGVGGGIFADKGSTLNLYDGLLQGNQANIGGAIAIQGSFSSLPMHPLGSLGEQISFRDNDATSYTSPFGAVTPGIGGAIYSKLVDIDTLGSNGKFSVVFEGNVADQGGAIFVDGDQTTAGDFTSLKLRNVQFESNTANDQGGAMYSVGAVDWVLDSVSYKPCDHPVLGSTLCSLIHANQTLSQGSNSFGAAAIFIAGGATDAHRGIARIRRTAIIGNNALNGGAVAVGMADDTATEKGEFFIERSILADNTAALAGGALLSSTGAMRCNYCTVTDNTVSNLFVVGGMSVNLQGSILWNPGATPVFSPATVASNGCLIAHSKSGLPTDTVVVDPKLDADYRPAMPSAPLDFCDNFQYTAITDAYNKAPVDITELSNQPFNGYNDLGAIEQVDVIFFSGFGSRPYF